MELREAIRHACDGEAILFLGSGFSFGEKTRIPCPIHRKREKGRNPFLLFSGDKIYQVMVQ